MTVLLSLSDLSTNDLGKRLEEWGPFFKTFFTFLILFPQNSFSGLLPPALSLLGSPAVLSWVASTRVRLRVF
jgi:hypothetical protein